MTPDKLNSYFEKLEAIVKKDEISRRIRFMIQDVIDLRKRRWKPRQNDNTPKNIYQVHRNVPKERKDQEKELVNPQFQGKMGVMSRDGRMRDRRDDGNRTQSRMLTHFIVLSKFFFSGTNDLKIDTGFQYPDSSLLEERFCWCFSCCV